MEAAGEEEESGSFNKTSPSDDVLMILTGPGGKLEGEHKSPISNLFFSCRTKLY